MKEIVWEMTRFLRTSLRVLILFEFGKGCLLTPWHRRTLLEAIHVGKSFFTFKEALQSSEKVTRLFGD
jgi:hypothetical protein